MEPQSVAGWQQLEYYPPNMTSESEYRPQIQSTEPDL